MTRPIIFCEVVHKEWMMIMVVQLNVVAQGCVVFVICILLHDLCEMIQFESKRIYVMIVPVRNPDGKACDGRKANDGQSQVVSIGVIWRGDLAARGSSVAVPRP